MITSDDVCCNMRNVKFIKVMQFKQMFVTALRVLFLLKLKWPKSKIFMKPQVVSARWKETAQNTCIRAFSYFVAKSP